MIKTYREGVVLLGICSVAISAGMFLRCTFGCGGGTTPGLTIVMNLAGAVFLCGLSIYLFGIAIRRPVALRKDEDGISGYYAPPLTWGQIAEFDVYEEYLDGGPFYTTHVGVKVTHSGALFSHQTPCQPNGTARRLKKTGFHILIPQIMLNDFSANAVVWQVKVFQDAARERTKN